MIQHVYKPNRKGAGHRLSKENYRGRYRLHGDARMTDVSLHTTDRRVAEQRLDDLIREREQERAGIIAPKALRDGAARPLVDHLAECVADLKAKGRAKRYYSLIESRCKVLATACGWVLPKDVTADSFMAWRAGESVKSPKTLNEYLGAACVLLNWMTRHGRLIANPLKSVGKVQAAGKEKVKRRALTDDEVRRLLDAAGPRKVVYLLAVLTGLRRGELKALQWGDVHLDAPTPFLDVRASTTKNHKGAILWLRDDLVAELRAIRPANVSPAARVLRVPKPETVRADLEAAGIALLDAQGRKVDLHALRHTLATNLARGGVAPRVAMELMRHSDMRLTAKTYTDAGLLPTAEAMDKLPRYDREASAIVLAATGTDGPTDAKMRSQKRSQAGVAGRVGVSLSVANSPEASITEMAENTGDSDKLAGSVASCQQGGRNEGDGSRTRNISAISIAPERLKGKRRSQTHLKPAGDSLLGEVADAWPHLSHELRAAVLAIVRASAKGRGGKP